MSGRRNSLLPPPLFVRPPFSDLFQDIPRRSLRLYRAHSLGRRRERPVRCFSERLVSHVRPFKFQIRLALYLTSFLACDASSAPTPPPRSIALRLGPLSSISPPSGISHLFASSRSSASLRQPPTSTRSFSVTAMVMKNGSFQDILACVAGRNLLRVRRVRGSGSMMSWPLLKSERKFNQIFSPSKRRSSI